MAPVALAAVAQEPDSELIERLAAETGAADRPAEPGWASYLGHLVGRLGVLLAGGLARSFDVLGPTGMSVVGWVAVALAVVAVGWTVAAIWRRRRGRAPGAAPASTAVPVAAERSASPQAWRRRFEERLEAGDTRGALEALWWSLAVAWAGGAVEESWTTRQLLAASRRWSLAPELARLDRMAYGPESPEAADVRSLALRLEGAA